ncbi:hypothetical protein AB0L62_26030 [Nocardia asteroides]|uniref:hypothetical protein n=1 Tax=Nocardia asteroides TaxID=1824 RepID=UPI00341E251E
MTRHPRESSNDHLVAKGLSATGLAGLFLLLRLFAITDYDWNAAFSVVGTIGIDDVAAMVIGTLMAAPDVGGFALAVLLPIAIVHQIRLGKPSWDSAGNLAWLITLALFTAALLWTYRMWWVPVVAGVLTMVLVLLYRKGRKGREGYRIVHWVLRSSALIVTLAALILAAVVQNPWVSLERITTEDGVIEGYVMENPPGFLKVLLDEDREMIIVDTADVTHREEIDPAP